MPAGTAFSATLAGEGEPLREGRAPCLSGGLNGLA